MRETVLRFAACSTDLIALPRAFTVTIGGGGEAIREAGSLCRERADARSAQVRSVARHRSPRHQQADDPDRAAMRVAAAGGMQHVLCAGAAELREFSTQKRGWFAVAASRAGERREGWFQRMCRAQHVGEIEVAMRTAAAPVDQCGFRRELSLCD